MYLLEKTRRRRKAAYCSDDGLLFWPASSMVVPAISGRPIDSGVSRRFIMIAVETKRAITAGMKKQRRQLLLKSSSMLAQRIKIAPPPSECDAFQKDIFVAISLGEN